MNVRNGWQAGLLVLGLGVGLGGASPASANAPIDHPPSIEPRVPGARAVDAYGLVTSEGAGEPFRRVITGETVYTRDLILVLPGLKTVLEPRPHSVQLTLWGNLPGLSDSPVLESAVILHDSRHYDLDLTLVRGRVVFKNNKEKGPAKIWVRGRRGIEFILAEPGDEVAIEVYGRWSSGTPFRVKPRPGEMPTIFWELNVLKGNVEIKSGKEHYTMQGPPGPSYLHGDAVTGSDPAGPQRRGHVPAWANPKAKAPPEQKTVMAVVAAYRAGLGAGGAREVSEGAAAFLAFAIKDKIPERAREARRMWVHAMAATDNVELVADALGDSRFQDMRQNAVIALRHWIGAAPGRDQHLYQILIDNLAYTKAEAEAVLQLLHSPFQPDQPETYEALIAYLKHSKIAVRELAAWHLYRLAPAGRDIAYNAAAPLAEREKSYAAWKKLIPSGELPPEPKAPGKAETPRE